MSLKKRAEQATGLLLGLVVLSLLLGQILGQPILLGYVTTGSMQPTLDPGDGFVAVPHAVAGQPERGDVITFRAENLHGGGLTTHRVVRETERGYITKGDANPFTDQDGKEPPVKEPQIVAEALQIGGHVVVIPHLGTAVTGVQSLLAAVQRRLAILFGTGAFLGTQGLALLLFGLSMLAYAVETWRAKGTKHRARDRSRSQGYDTHLIVGVFTLVVVASLTAPMVLPAGQQEFGVVSAESDAPGVRIIETGTTEELTYRVPNGGLTPVVVFLEPGSDGVELDQREFHVAGRSHVNTTLALSAPPQTGYYRRFVVEHRYLAVLPTGVIRSLYRVHPWAPIVAIDALIGGAFYLFGIALLGTGRIRTRTREKPSRVGRLLRRLG